MPQAVDGMVGDLQASASGYGHTSCPQGIPVEFALLSILAAFGVAFGILYMALTQITGRRKRRSGGEVGGLGAKFGDLLWLGESVASTLSCPATLPSPA